MAEDTQIRENRSSVEISRNAKGDVALCVKTYHETTSAAALISIEVFEDVCARLGLTYNRDAPKA